MERGHVGEMVGGVEGMVRGVRGWEEVMLTRDRTGAEETSLAGRDLRTGRRASRAMVAAISVCKYRW